METLFQLISIYNMHVSFLVFYKSQRLILGQELIHKKFL